MSSVTLENLVSVAEAAKTLGIDASLVRRYCKLGRLRAEHKGRAWLIDAESIEKFTADPPRRGNPAFGPEFWKKRGKRY